MFPVDNALKRAHAVLFEKDKNKSFGFGDSKREEATCENFQVYMACKGYLDTDKRHVQLEKGSTVGDARAAFGRPMRQQKVTDEDAYRISEKDPIAKHSRDCRISLVFAYDKNEEKETLKEEYRRFVHPEDYEVK
mmetsp:Transcript_9890/g.16977  ORF Transcript_9890/g.16977 Transcript_9890/m.16977 type:complete len:135 (-) Transcript_9890:317-721(-)|eukprot:CAMPEP_0198212328 /NCGR_PEP_ID=MMETSP1445-20131203/25655_1 /TAXON_ID=36898 /ORGANISM="Pyramimonas sp., Strain CCMP2087" /LENGTH=134 /DNA_ID=CAMNT_0043886747 /DNA_START=245 /DNA_END=649 /DNA_ORIENTATION=-